jgi:hypothetical protein
VSDDTPPEGLRIEVTRGAPDDDELAALIAVVGEGYEREAAETVAEASRRSAWELSRRALRQPLPRERGWGRFGG